MKVLQINSVCGKGSTGRIATDLYQVLNQEGHECIIAYGRGASPEGINAYRIGSDLDVKLHGVYTRITDKTGFASSNATRRLIDEIKKYNPDVIHLHNIHGYYINIGILFNYLSLNDKPIIWTLHDCWAFTGHCAHFDYVNCNKWKVECGNCPQQKVYPASFIQDNSKWNYITKKALFTSVKNMTLVSPSNWLAGLLKESFLSKYSIKVINNGIDLKKFRPTPSDFKEKYGLQGKKIILGVANIWDHRKGLDSFIELSKKLNESYKVVIVGVTEKLKSQLPHNIIGITKTNSIQTLAEIYTAADLFVNPTLEDNFPTTNIEALACGTPVITYNTGGSSEIVDRSCGAVVQSRDCNQLAKVILEMSNRIIKPEVCIAKAAKSYNMQLCFEKYVNMFTDIYESSRFTE